MPASSSASVRLPTTATHTVAPSTISTPLLPLGHWLGDPSSLVGARRGSHPPVASGSGQSRPGGATSGRASWAARGGMFQQTAALRPEQALLGAAALKGASTLSNGTLG